MSAARPNDHAIIAVFPCALFEFHQRRNWLNELKILK